MVAHRYWRIQIDTTAYGNIASLAEISLIDRSGVKVAPSSGGMASASSIYDSAHNADAALDGNTATFWSSTSVPAWWEYDFGVGQAVDLGRVIITPQTDVPSTAPQNWYVQWSDDNIIWQSVFYRNGTTWSSGVAQSFDLTVSPVVYRILMHTNDGEPFSAARILFKDSSGTVLDADPTAARASDTYGSYGAGQAVNGNGTFWDGDNNNNGIPHFWEYTFTTLFPIASVAITSRNDQYFAQTALTFDVVAYSGATGASSGTGTVLGSYTAAPWSQGSTQTFIIPAYSPTPSALRVTQVSSEAWSANPSALRVTQVNSEAWSANPSALRVTQIDSEAWVNVNPPTPITPSNIAITQTGSELWLTSPANVATSQTGLENWSTTPSNIATTQTGLETWIINVPKVPPIYRWNEHDTGNGISVDTYNTYLQAIGNSNGGYWYAIRATPSYTTGKLYFELTMTNVTGYNAIVGIASISQSLSNYIGSSSQSIGYQSNGTILGAQSANLQTYGDQDVIGIALDVDNKKIWFRKNNGMWNNDVIYNQNPSLNVGGLSISGLIGNIYLAASVGAYEQIITVNFGATPLFAPAPSGFYSPIYMVPANNTQQSLQVFIVS